MSIEKLVTDVQGPGEVDVIGDVVVVLDEQLRVLWTWNAFDHLDVSRMAFHPRYRCYSVIILSPRFEVYLISFCCIYVFSIKKDKS